MVRFWFVVMMVSVSQMAIGQGTAPALPFYDWKTGLGEHWRYGSWTALRSIPVYDTWKEDRRQVARIVPGEKVEAITSVHVTVRPGVIRMERAIPERGLKAGDTILTYAYVGEGFAQVWFEGKYYTDFDISFTKWPDGGGCGGDHCRARLVDVGRHVRRAQVRLGSGVTGWVDFGPGAFALAE